VEAADNKNAQIKADRRLTASFSISNMSDPVPPDSFLKRKSMLDLTLAKL
jgi:hypothetical protein